MTGERYVVLGISRARAPWFGALAQWVNSSSIPVELVKCLSVEEVRVRVTSGRVFSAVLADGGLALVDRDLIDSVNRAGCPTIVVDDGLGRRDWTALGATAVLPDRFDQASLMGALRAHAPMVRTGSELPDQIGQAPTLTGAGRLVAVCGPGGTGASTCSIALAQWLGSRSRLSPSPSSKRRGPIADADGRVEGGVLLADFARHAEQSMLHDAGDVLPGIREAVESHRHGRPTSAEMIDLTFVVVERGYHLLLGLHRPTAWSTLKPRAFEVTLDTLLQTFGTVVCDVDADLEGEGDGGSIDVAERNVMARTTVARADAVFAVGSSGMKGVYSLARVVRSVVDFGVPPASVVPVITRAPRSARWRGEMAAALASLTNAASTVSPVFVPDRNPEDALRDGTRLPSPITAPLGGALSAVLARSGNDRRTTPEPVVPGSLGGPGLQDARPPRPAGAMST